MSLHSNRLFCLWTVSGCIGHPRMACFAFLARVKTADSRCYDHFVRDSKSNQENDTCNPRIVQGLMATVVLTEIAEGQAFS